ncbi:MAG: SDR family oxidoreductase [Paracoccaceae bacterium]
MTFELAGKVALVTGAGRGMGAETARLLAAQGARVVVANRTVERAEVVAQEIRSQGGQAFACPYEGESRDGNAAVIRTVIEVFGALDIVIQNAGLVESRPLSDLTEAELDATLAVNLGACFWLAQAAQPHMQARGGGRIVITSSVTGPRVAIGGMSAYAASKAGVNGFIRAAALELAKDGITVNGVEPGFIAAPDLGRTGQDARSLALAKYIPVGAIGQPADIAHAMLFLASDEARYITGQTIVVDGGATLPESPLLM